MKALCTYDIGWYIEPASRCRLDTFCKPAHSTRSGYRASRHQAAVMALLTCKGTCSVQESSRGLLTCGVRQGCQEHDGSLRSKSCPGPGRILNRLQPGGFKQCPAARPGFEALSPGADRR